jgi:hypothetical protein
MHTVKTSIITDCAGQITGYGLTIEAATSGDPEEIQAAIAASLDMLRRSIDQQLTAHADPPPGHAPAAPHSASDAAPVGALLVGAQPARRDPPRTPAEAERRFFARYGDQVGGQDWAAVRRYLSSRAPKPSTVDGWISVAETVRDKAQA